MEHDDADGAQTQVWLPAERPVGPTPDTAAPAGYGSAPDPYARTGPAPQAPSPAQTPYGAQAPYGPQGYYPPQGYYGQPPQQRAPVLAIVGLVLAFVVPPAGVIVSIVAAVRARRGGRGRGLAIGGIVAGTITTLLGVAALFMVIHQGQDMWEARSAYQRLEDALVDEDCVAYMANSTEAFRHQIGVLTCDDFAAFVAPVPGDPVGLGNVPVTGVEVHGDTATVSTLENMGSDADGDPTLQAFDYTLVR